MLALYQPLSKSSINIHYFCLQQLITSKELWSAERKHYVGFSGWTLQENKGEQRLCAVKSNYFPLYEQSFTELTVF